VFDAAFSSTESFALMLSAIFLVLLSI
jgi:hypothetical protein